MCDVSLKVTPIHATITVNSHWSPISFWSVIDPSAWSHTSDSVIASHYHWAVQIFYRFCYYVCQFLYQYLYQSVGDHSVIGHQSVKYLHRSVQGLYVHVHVCLKNVIFKLITHSIYHRIYVITFLSHIYKFWRFVKQKQLSNSELLVSIQIKCVYCLNEYIDNKFVFF